MAINIGKFVKDIVNNVTSARTQRVEARNDRKEAKFDAKYGAKEAKSEDKYDYRSEKQNLKWGAFNTAYEQGIDPRASAYGAVTGAFNATGQTASNILGNGGFPVQQQNAAINPTVVIGIVGAILLIVLAFMFLKK